MCPSEEHGPSQDVVQHGPPWTWTSAALPRMWSSVALLDMDQRDPPCTCGHWCPTRDFPICSYGCLLFRNSQVYPVQEAMFYGISPVCLCLSTCWASGGPVHPCISCR